MPPTLGSATAHADLSKLLDEVREFAGGLIGQAGGCPPFGTTVGADGKLGLVVGQMAPGKSPQEQIDMLVGSVREQATAESLRAASIAYPITMQIEGQRIDAILASVHHRSGQPLDVVVPFRRQGQTVQFADPVVRAGTLAFF
jgi:hypothetical protein